MPGPDSCAHRCPLVADMGRTNGGEGENLEPGWRGLSSRWELMGAELSEASGDKLDLGGLFGKGS